MKCRRNRGKWFEGKVLYRIHRYDLLCPWTTYIRAVEWLQWVEVAEPTIAFLHFRLQILTPWPLFQNFRKLKICPLLEKFKSHQMNRLRILDFT